MSSQGAKRPPVGIHADAEFYEWAKQIKKNSNISIIQLTEKIYKQKKEIEPLIFRVDVYDVSKKK